MTSTKNIEKVVYCDLAEDYMAISICERCEYFESVDLGRGLLYCKYEPDPNSRRNL